MGIEDRDWYTDAQRKRQGYTEKSNMRRSLGKPEPRWYNPKEFRRPPGGGDPSRGRSGTRGDKWWYAIVFCLAIYGATILLKDLYYRFAPPIHYTPPVFLSPK